MIITFIYSNKLNFIFLLSTISRSEEEFPFFTGIIFGINKVTIPILCFFDGAEMFLLIDSTEKRLKIGNDKILIQTLSLFIFVSDYSS